jgi:hypothetical protein
MLRPMTIGASGLTCRLTAGAVFAAHVGAVFGGWSPLRLALSEFAAVHAAAVFGGWSPLRLALSEFAAASAALARIRLEEITTPNVFTSFINKLPVVLLVDHSAAPVP